MSAFHATARSTLPLAAATCMYPTSPKTTCWRVFVLLTLTLPATAQPISLHPGNPHIFLFRNRPTVLVTSAEHYGAVVNLDFDFVRYLETLQADGMNYARIFAGTYLEDVSSTFGIEFNTLAPAAGRAIVPWRQTENPGRSIDGRAFDLDRWNEAYFERLKAFLREADRRDIVVEITLFSSIYHDRNWTRSPMHPDNNVNGVGPSDFRHVHTADNGGLLAHQERFVRKIVHEANGFDNLFFEIQNEPWADQTVTALFTNPNNEGGRDHWAAKIDVASPASLEWHRSMARVIEDEESRLPKRHLIAQNFANFFYPIPEVDPLISILHFHYAWPDAVTLNYGYDRVVGFDESGFSGTDDATYRRQAWRFMLAGGGLFNNLDYSFVVGHEDGSMVENRAPGRGSPALRAQLKVLREFLERFDLVQLRPDHNAVRHAPGCRTQTLTEPGSVFAVYLENIAAGEAGCSIALEAPAGLWHAEWIDPESGALLGSDTLTHSGGVLALAARPFVADAALRLTRIQPGSER